MFLRKRCRCGSRKLQLLLLLLMLTFLLLMVTMLNPPTKDLNKEGISPSSTSSPKEGYQVGLAEPQEILDIRKDSPQYFPMEVLSSFISLREDELLMVLESPTVKRNHSKFKKEYQIVRQKNRRQEEEKQLRDPHYLLQVQPLLLQDGEETDTGELLSMTGLERHGFNEALSRQIPLHRELPEIRHPLKKKDGGQAQAMGLRCSLQANSHTCPSGTSGRVQRVRFPFYNESVMYPEDYGLKCLQQELSSHLPTASVIICFHEEAWSTLLRTVHSVLDTAPKGLLKEILLVDDFSKQGYLKSPLSDYIAKLAGVKLIKSNKRLGVIRGRMLGAARATGDILVFMDSHCECHRGWLEPLLDRLASNRSRAVSPVIDIIDWKTFQYYHSMDLQRGVFDWSLDFHWEPLPEREKKIQQSPISPLRSPAIPGGVVAVDRHYFQNTGGYDSDMTAWGSENLELSLKTWLCGGSVEILPCSHVGHVYRIGTSDNFPDEEAVERDKIRIAETWLDSFKDTFYKYDRMAFLSARLRNPTAANVFSCKRD